MSDMKCQCGKDIRETVSHNKGCEALFTGDPLVSIAESLERLADIAEYQTRRELNDYGNTLSIKELIDEQKGGK